jgi:hypothetical protein
MNVGKSRKRLKKKANPGWKGTENECSQMGNVYVKV